MNVSTKRFEAFALADASGYCGKHVDFPSFAVFDDFEDHGGIFQIHSENTKDLVWLVELRYHPSQF